MTRNTQEHKEQIKEEIGEDVGDLISHLRRYIGPNAPTGREAAIRQVATEELIKEQAEADEEEKQSVDIEDIIPSYANWDG
jgi:hypothetical protein